MGDGPLMGRFYTKTQECAQYWYLNMLMINNWKQFIVAAWSRQNACLLITWYFPVDFVYYLIAPWVVRVYLWRRKVALFCVAGIAGGSVVVQIVMCVVFNMSMSFVKEGEDYYDFYYYLPQTRICPFLIGLVFGFAYLAHVQDDEENLFKKISGMVQESTFLKYVIYAVGFNLAFWMIFLNYFEVNHPDAWGRAAEGVYLICARPLFVIGVALLVYPSLINNSRIFVYILGNSFSNVIAKLAFCAYFVHEMIIELKTFSIQKAVWVSQLQIWIQIFGYILFTLILSTVLTVIIEQPFRRLQREFLFGKRIKEHPKYERKVSEEIEIFSNDSFLINDPDTSSLRSDQDSSFKYD